MSDPDPDPCLLCSSYLLGCKESVYGIVEDINKSYERYLSIQMGFVITARMYCYSVNYSLHYIGGLYTSTISAN